MKELILLYTRNIPFKFDGNTYQQKDNLVMGSPLALFLQELLWLHWKNPCPQAIRSFCVFGKGT